MKSTPQSASGRVGGWRMAPLIAEWPRGSFMRNRRMWSRGSMKYRRRSNMVAPGNTPAPPVTTRVGIPSVCESTAWKTRSLRMGSVKPFREGRLGGLAHRGGVVGGEGYAWVAAGSAVAPGDVHAELDRLDELGPGVPAQQRVQGAVQRQREGEIARSREGRV